MTVLRSAPLLDPEGGLLKQLLLPFKLGVGGPLAGGDQYMPWIHRDDEVGLILWALDNDDGPRTRSTRRAPNPVTNREFSKTLGRVLSRPAVMPVPRFALVAMRGEELTDADHRQHARGPAPRARPRLPSSASRSSSRRCATCCGD